ncbi:MAG: hypothetical protein LUQ28_03530 [Methylococcaceae bacterium]|nr:hypothetical protein [Methylococcaceae bacterium]MDD1615584.1 hypothetical protein [Methylococcaceae bacterium]
MLKMWDVFTKARKRILHALTISLLTQSPEINRILFVPPCALFYPFLDEFCWSLQQTSTTVLPCSNALFF